jgi:hypothetical protein
VQLGGAAAEDAQRAERGVAGGEPIEQPAPAVASVADQLLGHRQRPGPGGVAVLEAPGQAGCMAEARALGQEASDLDVGIDADGQPPEMLENQRVAEHDRGVALLAGQPARRHVGRQGPERARARRHDLALRARHPRLAGDERQQGPAEPGVVEAVARGGAVEQRQRIAVVTAVVQGHPRDPQRAGADAHAVLERDRDDAPALAREPPLPGDPPREGVGAPRGQIAVSSMP